MSGRNLIVDRFLNSAQQFPDRPALTVAHRTWTYQELLAASLQAAEQISSAAGAERMSVTAVIADRTCAAYFGVLAALLSGGTYVPINPKFPTERNRDILRRSQATHIIASQRSIPHLDQIVSGLEPDSVTIVPFTEELQAGRGNLDNSIQIGAADGKTAYVLFTSGSTGVPKGVAISYANLSAYIAAASDVMDVSPDDRFSQTFELTFDLSVHDLFMAWCNGAHLSVPSTADLMAPAEYLRREDITCWFCVPTLARLMRQQGALTPAAFPSLRWSLFCGEALPSALAREWIDAAPTSIVENWYGPTEATIACTRYRLTDRNPTDWTDMALVPIGEPFGDTEAIVRRDDRTLAADGETGELLIGGPQVAPGYLGDPDRTAASFVDVDGSNRTFYRTGDRVFRDPDGILHFVNRLDGQVKIRGHRVELGEVETVLQSESSGRNAVAIAWPPDEIEKASVVAAVEGPPLDPAKILDGLRRGLPAYMIPSRIFFLDRFPVNASGKTDRRKIADLIKQKTGSGDQPYGTVRPENAGDWLAAAIRDIAPHLDITAVRNAEFVMDGGLDSLGFVELTAAIEKAWAIDLNPEKVSRLSYLSFDNLAAFLSEPEETNLARLYFKPSKGSFLKRLRARFRRPRGALWRAVEFLEKFPDFLAGTSGPICIAIGSSGTAHAFSPSVFNATMGKHNVPITSANVGLRGLDCEGIARICAFVADTCRAQGIRLESAILELDPRQVSMLGSDGDTKLDERYFRQKPPMNGTKRENWQWNAEKAGEIQFDFAEKEKEKRIAPNWSRRRDYEVVRTYNGEIAFDDAAVNAWISGARALAQVADNLFGFIHPLNPEGMEKIDAPATTHLLQALLRRINSECPITMFEPDAFELEPSDFENINHVNSWTGRDALTRQLAELVFHHSHTSQLE